MTTRTRSPRRSHLRTGIAGGLALALAAGLAGMAPASSEPMSVSGSAPSNPLTDGPYSPFGGESSLETISIGNGRAKMGRPDPFARVRNPALPAVKKLLSQAEIDAAMKRALRNVVFDPKPTPIPDDVLRQIGDVSSIAGAAPVIGRLPVSFDAFEVGKSYRDKRKFDDSVWKGADFAYGTDDPAIAKAARAVFAAVAAQPEMAQRMTDQGLAYSAIDAVQTGLQKPIESGVRVSGTQAFAQLGVTPFVRILATPDEVVDLYDRGLIVGVHLDGSTTLDLDESSEWIQSDRYQSPQSRRQWDPSLQRHANGSGTTVAVLDTGVDIDHPGFGRGAIVDGACFISCDGAEDAADVVPTVQASNHCSVEQAPGCDHGTHVAAIIAGNAVELPNGAQVPEGVAPSARIASYRVMGPVRQGDGTFSVLGADSATTQALGRATTRAADLNIVAANISMGTPNRYQICPTTTPGLPELNDPAFAAAVGTASAAGISVITSNGNEGRFWWGPCDPTMIVVANAQKDGSPRTSSSFHPRQTTLWAPGTDIVAASIDNAGNAVIESKSGTSMAAPHVSGSVALIAQAVDGYNSSQRTRDEVTRAEVRDLMLGIDNSDGARVFIFDNRTGTDDMGITATNMSAPLLSLRNLWMLLAGGPMDDQDSVPTYTPTFNSGVVRGTPEQWTVTEESVRREFNSGATPFISRVATLGSGTFNLNGFAQRRLNFTLGSNTLLDGPFLTVHVKNGSVTGAMDGSGNAMPIERIAKGPQPCTRAGWIETIRIPVTAAQMDSRGDGPIVTLAGPDVEAIAVVEGVLASGESRAVAVDPRPLVFGAGSRDPSGSVDLGAHRPDLSTATTWVKWFDLDRITGDEPMIDDSFYARRFSTLGGTRVPNDAVSQDFFVKAQASSALSPFPRSSSGVIGWNEVAGIQDCAVALGHIWVGN